MKSQNGTANDDGLNYGLQEERVLPPLLGGGKGGHDKVCRDSNTRLVKDTSSIAVATLISRITGFGKQLLLLAVLGPAIASGFSVAATVPTMISELLLGAVLTAIVVPTLVRAGKEDVDGGAAFVRRLVTAAMIILTAGTILATLSAPLLATHVFLSQDGKVSTDLTTALCYLLLPAILFYGMSALLTAILNTHEIFKPGAWAPVVNNVVVLAVLGLYAITPGEISLNPVRMGDAKLLTLGIGVTIGVVAQILMLIIAVRKADIDIRPLWGIDTRMKQFAAMAAAIIVYVMVSQAGFVVATRVSSSHDAAGPAIYQIAWLLLQLPYGVLGVTVLTAIMPRLSRNAAAEDTPAVVDDLGTATKLTMISLVPVVAFLTIAGPQVGEALLGYGRFGTEEAERLGYAVSWSAFTLIPYTLVLIHLRVFYAREQAWMPTWIVLGITATKIVLSLLVPVVLSDNLVVIGLGVANGVGYIGGAVIGGWLLQRSLGRLRMSNVGRTISRVVASSVAGTSVMVLVEVVLALHRLSDSFGGVGSLGRVAIDAVVMFGVTFLVMWLLGIAEIHAITVAVARRFGWIPPAPSLEASAAADETVILPKVDSRYLEPYYYRFDQNLDTQTMVLPVIRPGSRIGKSDGVLQGREGAEQIGIYVDQDSAGGRTEHASSSMLSRPRDVSLSKRSVRPPELLPGAFVAEGRYRLLSGHGGSGGLKFWHALDVRLHREVALTFVDSKLDATENMGSDGPQAILSRTLRLGRLNTIGLARILDVIRGSSGGIVVAEWTPGSSLRDLAREGSASLAADQVAVTLAAAADMAHRFGLSLSIDHPDRVRITDAGHAVLAFPGTFAYANSKSDLWGVGAIVFALATEHWPYHAENHQPKATIGGLPVRKLKTDGTSPDSASIEPEAPAAAMRLAIRLLAASGAESHMTSIQDLWGEAGASQNSDLLPVVPNRQQTRRDRFRAH
ncbi:murein biosynthesis integral membrane protein MurJ [Nocardia sp. NPDC057272]|uniref:murein biosynthesis integral membrane protein MurJ n=1 Tax=Nocardia sp. NPDC057272 TaxID=3346079 RepID=UPI0036289E75